jgi:hypothetical protein
VQTYRNAQSKDEKRAMEKLINQIKNDFESEIAVNDKRLLKLNKLKGELIALTTQTSLFEQTAKEKAAWNKQVSKLTQEINALELEIEEIKSNKIYDNALEWRFEFPEVLNDDGEFVGFDVVIGNPPYKLMQPNETPLKEIEFYKSNYLFTNFKIDLFHLFFQLGLKILGLDSVITFIAPSSLLNNVYAEDIREYIRTNFRILQIGVAKEKVFEDADVHTAIYFINKSAMLDNNAEVLTTTNLNAVINSEEKFCKLKQESFQYIPGKVWNLLINEGNMELIKRISSFGKLNEIASINRGLITGDREKYFSSYRETEDHFPILTGADISRYSYTAPSEFVLFERPKTSGGCWDRDVHFAPFKICIRQIGFEPMATLIDKPIAVTGNIFTIIHPNVNLLKCILGILNSRLIKFYWQIMFSDFKSSFPQVTIFSLNQIPIPSTSNPIVDKIVSLVDDILIAKSVCADADTINLENRLDEEIFSLYGVKSPELNNESNSFKM